MINQTEFIQWTFKNKDDLQLKHVNYIIETEELIEWHDFSLMKYKEAMSCVN